jgi:uncharacterized protein YfbU (UPF0304 family)
MIKLITFPITEDASFYSNFFRGFVKENIELRMQDESSCDAKNDSGFVKLDNFTDFVPSAGANDGETIVIVGGDYDPSEGAITAETTGPGEILTNIPYIANATVRFYIKYANIRMVYRFSVYTSLDDQNARNLFNNEFTFYPDNFGNLLIDISIIKNLMKPNFDFTNEINTDMSKVFQVQYKTVYDGSSDTWHSAHDTGLTAFVPFISAHAGGRIAKFDNSLAEATPDFNLVTRMWRGYKKILSVFVAEDNYTSMDVGIIQYDLAKTIEVALINLASDPDNGMLNVTIPTLDADTRFVRLEVDVNTGSSVSYTNLTVYDTLLNENEFYLTWASENGTIRNWLFTSKAEFSNKAGYDILQNTQFRQIPNSYEENILLQAKGISKIEKDYLSDIYLSNKILVENDGEEIECILSKPSFSFENRSNSYICTIEIEKKERSLMNV